MKVYTAHSSIAVDENDGNSYLHGEPTRAEVEEVLERRAEQVHDEHVVLALSSVPAAKKYFFMMSIFEKKVSLQSNL